MDAMQNNRKTWLITGGNSGLGLAIVKAALHEGHRVIATARDVARAAKQNPEVEQLGGIWLELDVTSPDTQEKVAAAIEKEGGALDVVINNAGTMILTSLEDANMSLAESMMSTHVWGALRVMKAALPVFRAQKSGTIVNMSSFSGRIGVPGNGLYCLCKYALEGMSESCQAEVAPFNIRVIVLQPGAFRTPIIRKAGTGANDYSHIGHHYMDTAVGSTINFTNNLGNRQEELVGGDPAKLAKRVVELVDKKGYGIGLENVLYVPLGPDSVSLMENNMRKLAGEFELTRNIAQSTNFDGHNGGGATDL